jgi:hypothetical protein
VENPSNPNIQQFTAGVDHIQKIPSRKNRATIANIFNEELLENIESGSKLEQDGPRAWGFSDTVTRDCSPIKFPAPTTKGSGQKRQGEGNVTSPSNLRIQQDFQHRRQVNVVSRNRNGPQWSQNPLENYRSEHLHWNEKSHYHSVREASGSNLSNARSRGHPETSPTFRPSTFQIQPQSVANPSTLMGEVDAFLADKAIDMRGQQIHKIWNTQTHNYPSTYRKPPEPEHSPNKAESHNPDHISQAYRGKPPWTGQPSARSDF